MRKQDRILQQQNQDPHKKGGEQSHKQGGEQSQTRPNEPVKASASGAQPAKPPRQPGKPLPLPD